MLSKLGSISSGSRLSTPSPLARLSRSPTHSDNSRLSKDKDSKRVVTRSLSRASGSETERDRTQHDAYSSSEDLSETPTSTTSSHFRSQSVRERRATLSDNERIRIPLADSQANTATQRRAESRSSGDVEAAALAAVANSRRITPPDARRRQPLPREFRTSLTSFDGKVSIFLLHSLLLLIFLLSKFLKLLGRLDVIEHLQDCTPITVPLLLVLLHFTTHQTHRGQNRDIQLSGNLLASTRHAGSRKTSHLMMPQVRRGDNKDVAEVAEKAL